MRIHSLFVFSTYLCVSVATFCLGFVEQDQIKSVTPFYLLMGLLFLIAYLTEDRWKLTDWQANIAAVPLFGGWLVWVWLNYAGTGSIDEWQDYLRVLIPYGGPLLALLTLAKLLRGKNARDYWGLHVLALFQMVMACCMAYISQMDRDHPLFGFLLAVYVLSAIWSLNLFYLQREAALSDGYSYPRSYVLSSTTNKPRAASDRSEGTPVVATAPGIVFPWRFFGLPQGLVWFGLTAVVSLTAFFGFSQANPEGTTSLVLPGQARHQVGFSTTLDLNQTAPLSVTDALVMRVQAHDSSGNPVNLGAEQKWRGITCSVYEAGRWTPLNNTADRIIPLDSTPLRPLGKQLLLSYFVNLAELGSAARTSSTDELPRGVAGPRPLFLAEPLYYSGGSGIQIRPLVSLVHQPDWGGGSLLGFRTQEPVLVLRMGRQTGTLRYQQLHLTAEEGKRNWSPVYEGNNLSRMQSIPLSVKGADQIAAKAEAILTKAGIPTGNRVYELSKSRRLTEEAEQRVREQQARALERYLLEATDFTYSLERRRVDGDLDPTADFLLNGKEGHCQMFASALALMLRSQGISSRVVIGFRGNDWLSGGDMHEIRQYHSHAWVEAFIAGRDPKTSQVARGRWLSLDPTPGGGSAAVYHVASDDQNAPFQEEIHLARFLWESLILDYSGDMRPDRFISGLIPNFAAMDWKALAVAAVTPTAWGLGNLLAILAIGGALVFVSVAARRRRAATGSRTITVPFYARWLRIIARLDLRPRLAQTAAEFGKETATRLARQPEAANLAYLPARIVELFYAVRFGGRTLEPAQLALIEQELDKLAKAL
jgi:protein-glutamine gamma-glutamyltransferase